MRTSSMLSAMVMGLAAGGTYVSAGARWPHTRQPNQGPLSDAEVKQRADLRDRGRKGRRARQRLKDAR